MDPIIDIHAHLGDICYPGGGEIIEKKGVRKKLWFDTTCLFEFMLFRGGDNIDAQSFVNMDKWSYKRTVMETLERNKAGTRENFEKSMNKAGIRFSVSLPVPPYVTFADLKAAADKNSVIIPFTGIDFTREYDVESELAENVKAGAKGMKLHPILQGEKLTSKRTFAGVEAFAPHNLPVLMHTGLTPYYPDKNNTLMEQPSYGDIKYVRELVKAFPNVNFIIGHGGLFQKQEAMDTLGSRKNVWVDTTFGSPEVIRNYFKAYGPDRVLFGSDWPWGNRKPAIRCLKKACQGDKSLERRIFFENATELMQLDGVSDCGE
ncbi:MAG: amidohydrolase family protein [Deltaproteobacteria bacterium]|nr:amidohydrolase family protein [Deltaproteobacteria bacterium]